MPKTNKHNHSVIKQLNKYYPYGTRKVLAIDLGIKDSDLSTMIKVLPELMKKLKLTAIPEDEKKDKDKLIELLKRY